MQAVTRELTDPNETVLRGFGKQLGSSKKEIMTVSKDLVVDLPADKATEATRLASEACEAIKASWESIRAALRELGAASDISEASGPVRAQLPLPGRPVVGCIDPEWAAASWFQRPPLRAAGNTEPRWPPMHTPAITAWPPAEPLPRPKMKGEDGEL
jgi:hypothetical protein